MSGNLDAVHKAMYISARDLLQKQDDKGLVLLLRMRLVPDLSLFRRAMVNLLLAQCSKHLPPGLSL